MEYDAVKHAKVLIGTDGICDQPGICNDCSVCFRHMGRDTLYVCSSDVAYKDALKFLEKHNNEEKCVPIW